MKRILVSAFLIGCLLVLWATPALAGPHLFR